MRLSNMADYAVVMMSAAARHCGSSRVSATQLAKETGIALPTMQKLVTLLSKSGLLMSVRGTGGGISLARPAAAITLADIIEAVEGPIAMTVCVNEKSGNCAMEHNCLVKPHWAIVNGAIRDALSAITLATLSKAPIAKVSAKIDEPAPIEQTLAMSNAH